MIEPNKCDAKSSNQASPLAASRLYLVILGCAIGAAVGDLLMWLVAHFGYSTIVVPLFGFTAGTITIVLIGFATGSAASVLSRRHNLTIGCIVAAFSLTASLLVDWFTFPFLADPSLAYYLAHLSVHNLPAHALGALLGFFIGWKL